MGAAKEYKLDDHKDAYQENFEFFDDNIMMILLHSGWIKNSLKNRKNLKLLSLGLGYGHVANDLSALLTDNVVSKYDVLEGSTEVIELYKKNFGSQGLSLIHTYFEEFQSDVKYDAIEMGFILEHVKDPDQILNHFKKFLAPDGRMFISVPNAKSLHRIIANKAGMLDDIYELSPQDHQLGHLHFFDLESITKKIENAGFEVMCSKGIFLKPLAAGD